MMRRSTKGIWLCITSRTSDTHFDDLNCNKLKAASWYSIPDDPFNKEPEGAAEDDESS